MIAKPNHIRESSEARVIRAEGPELMVHCRAIRQAVFIDEQAVMPEEEWDGLDEQAEHFLAWVNGQPAATARVRRLLDKDGAIIAKIERVCVLKPYRGQKLGYVLMRFMMEELSRASSVRPVQWLRLEAQVQALPFYESLGFVAYGELFLDARIPHRRMQRKL
jgi:ElaA protein